MKKMILLLLALMLAFGCTAMAQEGNVIKVGALSGDVDIALQFAHLQEAHALGAQDTVESIEYDTLANMLLGLKRGDIRLASMPQVCSDYLMARNEGLRVVTHEQEGDAMAAYSMLVKEEDQQIYDAIENAIQAMQQDGSLEDLVESQLNAYIHSDPSPAEMPYFDGAPTVRVAVTGDIPPMDLVTVDGLPAGFNVALLTQIANHSQLNFELVAMDAGARLTALASDRVDVVFWSDSAYCEEHNFSARKDMEGIKATSPYFTSPIVKLFMA